MTEFLGPVLTEPVRGVIPAPNLPSLPGLEQVRAYAQRRLPATPHAHLMGYRVTQVSSGTVVVNQPISPWFVVNEGFVDLMPTAQVVMTVTANTAAPPNSRVRMVNLSLRYLRPCTVENGSVIARGRILHAGSSFTTIEALMEDTLGRAVAHATGSVVVEPIDTPAPPMDVPTEEIEEPSYATPGPSRRAVPDTGAGLSPKEQILRGVEDPSVLPPMFRFLDARVLDLSEGYARASIPTSEWFCNLHRDVDEGLAAMVGNFASGAAILSIAESDQRMVIVNQTTTCIAPVAADGRPIEAAARLRGERGGVLVSDVEGIDADGRTVFMGHGAAMLVDATRASRRRVPERVLLTVLFTDIVGSTERATDVGDAAWRQLMDEHDAVVRRQLELNRGREIKTMGDGFLATFDSPTRAVHCAKAVRDELRRLGLEIRAGVHTGECDVVGRDVSGIAVNAASRVQSVARSGEILVSNTVKDLVAGSDLCWQDRGEHELKGLRGAWRLFALADPASSGAVVPE